MSIAIDRLSAGADGAGSEASRVRVWDLPTRIFHWTFALSFAGAWLTSESERLQALHLMLGYTFAGLLGFRLVWGLVGSRYARFASFLFAPGQVKTYLMSLLRNKPEHHLGHNPAGALAIFLMLGLGIAVVASGLAAYQDIGGETLEELHEGVAVAMLAIVLIHIAGVVVSSVLHRENLARAMLTGWKRGPAEAGIPGMRKITGIALVVAIIGLWSAWQGGLAGDWLPSTGAAVERAGGHHGDDGDRD